MRTAFFPPQVGYIVVTERLTLQSQSQRHHLGKCFMRPRLKNDSGKNWGRHNDGKWIEWVLEPGEWWPIGSVWYPRKSESVSWKHLPIVSINIHRSFKGRKWVKEKMAKMAKENLDTDNFVCTDRTIVCSSADLNGKIIVAPDMETAIIYSKKVLKECQDLADPQTSRFTSLLLE